MKLVTNPLLMIVTIILLSVQGFGQANRTPQSYYEDEREYYTQNCVPENSIYIFDFVYDKSKDAQRWITSIRKLVTSGKQFCLCAEASDSVYGAGSSAPIKEAKNEIKGAINNIKENTNREIVGLSIPVTLIGQITHQELIKLPGSYSILRTETNPEEVPGPSDGYLGDSHLGASACYILGKKLSIKNY